MNINGIGSQSALSWYGRRVKEKEEQQEAPASVSSSSQSTVVPASSTNYQAEQAYEESFAKLRVSLQSAEPATSSLTSATSQEKVDATRSARQEFRDYMAMSDPEKLRASMLKELGITEEEFEQLPPEQQAAIEEKIVERIKENSDLQIARQIQESQARISSDPTAEEQLLLS